MPLPLKYAYDQMYRIAALPSNPRGGQGVFSGIVVEVRGRNQWFCGANRVKFGFFAALDCPMLPI